MWRKCGAVIKRESEQKIQNKKILSLPQVSYSVPCEREVTVLKARKRISELICSLIRKLFIKYFFALLKSDLN